MTRAVRTRKGKKKGRPEGLPCFSSKVVGSQYLVPADPAGVDARTFAPAPVLVLPVLAPAAMPGPAPILFALTRAPFVETRPLVPVLTTPVVPVVVLTPTPTPAVVPPQPYP